MSAPPTVAARTVRPVEGRRPAPMAIVVFVAASFLSAVLVFSVQPLATRMVLPDFGGSAAVWTTSVLFFQVVLLLGYAYSHVATNWLRPRQQVVVHLVLLLVPAIVLPLSVVAQPGDGGTLSVVTRLLAGLTAGVGLPFLLVSTSGPLLQRWFSWSRHPGAGDPYFLYAAGNVGSILGLVAYPVVIEPFLDLDAQSWAWTVGYGGLILLVAGCAMYVQPNGTPSGMRERVADESTSGHQLPDEVTNLAGPGGEAVGRPMAWIGLAFVPSSLMLGVTTFLTTDIASIPLLWVVPLAVYLATFVVAFGTRSRMAAKAAERLIAPVTMLAAIAWLARWPIAPMVFLVVASFAAIAMVFHHRLAASRPRAERLTAFYVWMSVGGALGGFANSVVAPLVLPGPFEFLIVVVVAAAVAGRHLEALVGGSSTLRYWLSVATIVVATAGAALLVLRTSLGWPLTLLVVCLALWLWWSPAGCSKLAMVGAVLVLAAPPVTAYIGRGGIVERSFFGSYRVVDGQDGLRSIYSGTTLHGQQWLDPARADEPISYYHSEGPLGDWLPLEGSARIGAVGLGAGSVAAYGQPGQLVRFHEIDPTVEVLARRHFSHLHDAAGDVEVAIGDGRLTVQHVADDFYDALIIDAFSSDAIPVHLLTREAFELYDRVLAEDGVLLVHISNRYLDLEPVVLAGAEVMQRPVRTGRVGQGPGGRAASVWMAASNDDDRISSLDPNMWSTPTVAPVTWTDDFSNILGVLQR